MWRGAPRSATLNEHGLLRIHSQSLHILHYSLQQLSNTLCHSLPRSATLSAISSSSNNRQRSQSISRLSHGLKYFTRSELVKQRVKAQVLSPLCSMCTSLPGPGEWPRWQRRRKPRTVRRRCRGPAGVLWRHRHPSAVCTCIQGTITGMCGLYTEVVAGMYAAECVCVQEVQAVYR